MKDSNQFKNMMDSLSDGILIIDNNKNILINKKFKKLFNMEDENPDVIMELLRSYGLINILNTDIKIEKEISVENKKILVESYYIHKSDEKSYIVSIFKEVIDIEETNSEIEELRQGLSSMKDILDNAYQGIVLVNEEGKIIKWNYEKLFGIKEEDVLGKPVEDVIENTRMHIVVKTGNKELYDIQRIQGHDMIASRTPIIKDGKIIGAVGTVLFKDVKEVKDLASKLKILENTVSIYKNELGKMYCANYTMDDIITQNPKMIELKKIAFKAATSSSTILIEGESGTGKEFFAHAIHYASNRKNAPFIRINCAAIPHELLESELFGYETGAFTGAKKEGKIGKLELANGGTVLLDEISSMPFNMQAKLLRVLEEREFERIGGNTGIKIDIRFIACTNENLIKLVEKGHFRHDLYYRLNVVEIKIPPLRERLDDLEILCEDILNRQLESSLTSKAVTDKAILAMKLYDWPGNVRELRNVLERAANISTGNFVTMQHLPEFISNKLILEEKYSENKQLRDKIAEAEIEAIVTALKASNGSRTGAAKILGIHRTALYKKLAGYGIDIKNIV
ncbi:MAG: sigma 54-interacting transcriptional regulator [Sedimentibacter sp.]